MRKTGKVDFSRGSVYKNIIRMALPMMTAQIVQLLYNIVDRMYIGHLEGVGTDAITGLGLCFPIILIVTAFCNLFSSGGSPLCAIEQGKGDDEEAERIVGNTFTMLFLTGVLLTALGLIFERPLLYLFGASDVTYPYASGYLRIYLLGTVFVTLGTGMNPFISSQGFGRTGRLTVVLGAAANIALDPLFIFVFDMGVEGAALATILSQLLSAVWVLKFLTGRKAVLRIRKKYLFPSFRRILRIMSLGLTGFIMSFTTAVTQIVCSATLSRWGGDLYVGVMTVLNAVREIFTMPIQGLTNGSSPVLGFNYGAQKYGEVKKGIWFTSFACIGFSLLAWLILFLFPEFFIRIFNTNPDLVEAGVRSLRIYFAGFFLISLQFAGQSTFVALGKARHAVFFSLLRKAVIVVPLTILLPMWGLGVDGVFWAEPISNLVGGAACFVTMLLTVMPKLRRPPDEAGQIDPPPSPHGLPPE